MSEKKKVKRKKQANSHFGKTIKPLKNKYKFGLLGIFIIISLALYFKCISFGYVLDDKIVITDNSYTKKGFEGIWDHLSSESFEGYFGEQKNLLQGGRYRPLSLITFAIEYELWGLNPALSHLINILFYAFCGFMAFITLRRLFGEKTFSKKVLFALSFISALLFIVHPIHTEAVANIKGRDELMAFFFSMAALFYALKYFDSQKLKYAGFIIIAFFLGMNEEGARINLYPCRHWFTGTPCLADLG